MKVFVSVNTRWGTAYAEGPFLFLKFIYYHYFPDVDTVTERNEFWSSFSLIIDKICDC